MKSEKKRRYVDNNNVLEIEDKRILKRMGEVWREPETTTVRVRDCLPVV